MTTRVGSGPVQIDRENRTRFITVYANLDGKAAAAAEAEVSGFVRELDLPTGYEFEPIGPSSPARDHGRRGLRVPAGTRRDLHDPGVAVQFFVHPFTILLSAPRTVLMTAVSTIFGMLPLARVSSRRAAR